MADETLFVEVIEPTAESKELAVTYTPATISDNLTALEAYIDKQLEPYVGAIIDPDDAKMVSQARKCMADLNKLKEPIEAERKRIKREYEAPLKAFEARVGEITGKIDGARLNLKNQVEAADAAFKQARYENLLDEYAAIAGPIADLISLDALAEKEWFRRSVTDVQAEGKLADKVQQALDGYKTLMATELTHKDEVVQRYCETLDTSAALKYEAELTERDQRMADFKAAQEALEAPGEQQQPEPETTPEEPPQQASEPVFIWHLSLDFTGTKTLAKQVGAALSELGLKGRITNQGATQ